jgi:hypothetical protein
MPYSLITMPMGILPMLVKPFGAMQLPPPHLFQVRLPFLQPPAWAQPE